jgi:hypothetical protein
MLLNAFVPEVPIGVALEQRSAAQLHEADGWSRIIGYYANMGGYVLSIPGHPGIAIDVSQLWYLVKNDFISWPLLSPQAIVDRSKADSITKGLACLQSGWLVTQCIARVKQHLPLTVLELTTVAYVPYAIIASVILWDKPLDVQIPTAIELLPFEGDRDIDLLLELLREHALKTRQAKNQVDCINAYIPDAPNYRLFFPGDSISLIFGVIHSGWQCLAWRYFFPTRFEVFLWRASTLAATLSFPAMLFFFNLGNLCKIGGIYDRGACIILAKLLMGVYIVARAAIIVEIFISLRLLPAEAFQTISWSNVLPHF